MTYKLEPLFIELNAPEGLYEVVLTINAESDCVYSVYDGNYGTVCENSTIKKGTSYDVLFNTQSRGTIIIELRCDGSISATALATYAGE